MEPFLPELAPGIVWALYPGDRTFAVEAQRTSDNGAGAPATSAWLTAGYIEPPALLFRDEVPVDGHARHYQFRHVRGGYADGPWTTSNWAKPVYLEEYQRGEDEHRQEARRRGDTLYESDSVIQSSVSQQGPTGTQVITRGRLSGQTLDDTTVTFPSNFDSPPMVLFTGGLSYEPRSSMWSSSSSFNNTTPQYQDMRALNLGVAGFETYAKLVQKGAAGSTGDDFGVANQLTTDGDTTTADASTDATASNYVWHYKVELHVTATDNPYAVTLDVDVARDSLSSAGAAWTERGVTNYSLTAQPGSSADQTWAHEQKFHSVGSTQLSTAGDNVRLRIKASDTNSAGPITSTEGTFIVHGFVQSTGDADHGITWQTTTEITASMTPSTGSDVIYWEALEV